MDQPTGWLLLVLAAAVAGGVLIRRRYGNLYASLAKAFEQATGLRMATVLRVLGILTLVGWAVIYVSLGDGAESDLDRLFRWDIKGASTE